MVTGTAGKQPQRLPVRVAEQRGVCKALGAVTGAAVGLADGFVLGVVVSTADPGIGWVTAIGFVVGTILGLAGAAAGAAAGSALDNMLTEGPPEDEFFVYEDAVRKHHSVVLAFPDDEETTESARHLLAEEGAESIDGARKEWTGLRTTEQEHYSERSVVGRGGHGKVKLVSRWRQDKSGFVGRESEKPPLTRQRR
jgi:hypothetical protein